MEDLLEAAANNDRVAFDQAFRAEMARRILEQINAKTTEILEARWAGAHYPQAYKLPPLDPGIQKGTYHYIDPAIDTPEVQNWKIKHNEKMEKIDQRRAENRVNFVKGAKIGRIVGAIAGAALGGVAGAAGGAVSGAAGGILKGHYYGGQAGGAVFGGATVATSIAKKAAQEVARKRAEKKHAVNHSKVDHTTLPSVPPPAVWDDDDDYPHQWDYQPGK